MPQLRLLILVVICLRTAVFAGDTPAKTVSYDEFKRREKNQSGEITMLTSVEAIAALHENDWPRRWDAAESLGLTGNRAAVDELIVALTNDEDWRLSFVSAIALGRLGDARAVPALTAVAESHWYPQVRSAARKALAVIAGRDSYPKDGKPIAGVFFIGPLLPDYLDQTYLEQLHVAYTAHSERTLRPGIGELTHTELDRAPDNLSTGSSLDRYRRRHAGYRPSCGLRVDGGILFGRSYGEWGGDLVFVSSPTDVRLLIDDNITGIHHTPSGIIAVAGCAHMGNRIAHLYLVTKSADGTWSARKWRSLPAAPRRSGFLPDGRLYIECANREDVALSADGKLTLAQ